MKRSSSIAALDDTIDVKLRNNPSYEDGVLVTSMMLVTIAEENRQASRMLSKQRSNGSLGSMSTIATNSSSLSRCSSRGSLRGWGSTASRKSYKVDLCSLADGISEDSIHHHSSEDQNKCPTLTLQHQKCGASGTAAASHALDSWGFFL